MVATSILAMGIVLVARGLLTASMALASAENRTQAVQFLEAKMVELQQQTSEEGGMKPGQKTGTTELNHRPATWTLEVLPIKLEETTAQGGSGSEPARAGTISGISSSGEPSAQSALPQKPTVQLAEARLTLSWQEARRKQDAELVTYLQQKQTAEPTSESGPTN